MSTQQDDNSQAPKLSIADKCTVTMNGHMDDELITEIDNLSDSVCRIVGAKVGQCRIPITSADELARLLADIRDDVEKGTEQQKVINTLDAAIELAFLHSPVYQDAFEIYRLDLTGNMYGEWRSAHEAIHEALLTARGNKTPNPTSGGRNVSE